MAMTGAMLSQDELLPSLRQLDRSAFPKPSSFAVGTVVYLKSGSPAMTVNSIRGSSQTGRNFVSVEWFNEAELKRDCFDPECLTTEKPAA